MIVTNRELRIEVADSYYNYKCTVGSKKIYRLYGNVLSKTFEIKESIETFEELEKAVEKLDQ